MNCLFVSDLHGNKKRYKKLFGIVDEKKPDAVFFGGDLLPNSFRIDCDIDKFLEEEFFSKVKKYNEKTRFFVIMGNDDPRVFEKHFIDADKKGLIEYVSEKTVKFNDLFVTGYPFVPPTPFQLKDWERYDVSRFVDVGGISPEEGIRTVDVDKDLVRFSTISDDLKNIVKNAPAEKTIFLFHSPPYNSNLDRAGLDGKMVDSAPMDVHVGSIAIQRFIEKYQPFLTLHGHIHETVSLTGQWREKFGKTISFTGSSYDSELVIIDFDTNNLEKTERMVFTI